MSCARAHLAAVGCNGQEITRAHLAAIGCKGLSAKEDRESCFHHCRGPVRLVKPVHVRERTDNAVLTS